MNSTQCINISIIDDNDFEGDDSFAVEISSIYPPIAIGTGDILYILLLKITMVTCTDKLSPLKYGVIIIVMIFLYISSSI